MRKRYFLATMMTLSGCAATPNLEYRAPGPDLDGFMKFTLPQASVVLTARPSGITATVVPDDAYAGAYERSLMADAQWSLWTSTTITKWEFTEGQSVVKAIGTSADSNLSRLLGVAKDVGSFVAPAATAIAFENDIIDPFTEKNGDPRPLPVERTVDCNLQRNPGWTCSITIGAYPKWVIPYAEFRQMALNGDARKVFPSSACVQATIRLLAPESRLARVDRSPFNEPDEFNFSIELADPAFVNLTRLRRGGDLQASGPCRFNVTNDKAGSNFDTQAFKDALALAKSLKAGTQSR